jgi:hypothetical protein
MGRGAEATNSFDIAENDLRQQPAPAQPTQKQTATCHMMRSNKDVRNRYCGLVPVR